MPFAAKACAWANRLLCVASTTEGARRGVVIVRTAASAWHSGVGLTFSESKHEFWSLPLPSHAKALLDKAGCPSRRVRALHITQGSVDGLRACGTRLWVGAFGGRAYKLCSHASLQSLEYDVLEVSSFTALALRASRFPVMRALASGSKRALRCLALDALGVGGALWSIGCGCARLSLTRQATRFEVSKLAAKCCVHNLCSIGLCASAQLKLGVRGAFEACTPGAVLPHRVCFECGLNALWHLRLALCNLSDRGVIVVLGVSVASSCRLGVVSSAYSVKLFSVLVCRASLKLNSRVFGLRTAVTVCVLRKRTARW
ncbi:hypothetical protein HCDSEM_007 [Candidatus Hodgkinia cicadicola Dsem]|nr:hypothetical protein HCDSEM_007 [Candidatus Hodgkinia cicadicola Dsem]